MPKLSVQLWSLKEKTKDKTVADFNEVFKKNSEFGYDGVEFAGFGDVPAKEMKQLLDKYGLEASGAHIGLEALEENFDELVAYNKTIDNKYIVCPSLDFYSYDDCINLHNRMAAISDRLKEQGITMGFHNHAPEFDKYNEEYAFDLLVGNDNKLVYEVDGYWATYAGVNVIDYLTKLGTRCPLIHLKDMQIDTDGKKCDSVFGEGIIEYEKIVPSAIELCKPEWFVIEWEGFGTMDAYDAVSVGLNNLKDILGR